MGATGRGGEEPRRFSTKTEIARPIQKYLLRTSRGFGSRVLILGGQAAAYRSKFPPHSERPNANRDKRKGSGVEGGIARVTPSGGTRCLS